MRVLVLKTSSLGDVIHGLRVMTSLKAQVPGVHVTWVVQTAFAPLVENCAVVDETIIFRRRPLVAGMRAVLRELRARRFDVALDLQGRFLTGLMTARSGAPRRVGRTDCREGSGMFYNERVPLPAAGRRSHAVDILLEFCAACGAKVELRGPPVFHVPEDAAALVAPVRGAGPVVMFPDSRREEKCWGGFAELTATILREQPERRVVWSGDRALTFAAANEFPGRFFNFTGRTPLVALPLLIREAAWVISNDSGPLHLAAALGAKALGIFGGTDPVLYGPYPAGQTTNHVIRAPQGNLRLLPAAEVFLLLKKADPEVFATR